MSPSIGWCRYSRRVHLPMTMSSSTYHENKIDDIRCCLHQLWQQVLHLNGQAFPDTNAVPATRRCRCIALLAHVIYEGVKTPLSSDDAEDRTGKLDITRVIPSQQRKGTCLIEKFPLSGCVFHLDRKSSMLLGLLRMRGCSHFNACDLGAPQSETGLEFDNSAISDWLSSFEAASHASQKSGIIRGPASGSVEKGPFKTCLVLWSVAVV